MEIEHDFREDRTKPVVLASPGTVLNLMSMEMEALDKEIDKQRSFCCPERQRGKDRERGRTYELVRQL